MGHKKLITEQEPVTSLSTGVRGLPKPMAAKGRSGERQVPTQENLRMRTLREGVGSTEFQAQGKDAASRAALGAVQQTLPLRSLGEFEGHETIFQVRALNSTRDVCWRSGKRFK